MTSGEGDHCPQSYTDRHSFKWWGNNIVCAFCDQHRHGLSGRVVVDATPHRT